MKTMVMEVKKDDDRCLVFATTDASEEDILVAARRATPVVNKIIEAELTGPTILINGQTTSLCWGFKGRIEWDKLLPVILIFNGVGIKSPRPSVLFASNPANASKAEKILAEVVAYLGQS